MKLKDIEVGKHYALKAPGSRGHHHSRVSVVEVGVHGEVHPSDSFWSRRTEKPNYVEIELVDPNAVRGDLSYRNEVSVLLEPHGHQKPGDPWIRQQHGFRAAPVEPKTRKAWRVPAGWIVRPWDEQERIEAEAEQARAGHQAMVQERESKARQALSVLGRVLGATLEYRLDSNQGLQHLYHDELVELAAWIERKERETT